MTKVWLREEKGRERSEGGYMETLLAELGELLLLYGEAAGGDDEKKYAGLREELLARIRAELIKSFKNGIMRGREGKPSLTTPRRAVR
jgi:hypothetical protein